MGAAASARAQTGCAAFDLDAIEEAIFDFDVIVVGELGRVPGGGGAAIAPEAYLRGPAVAADIPLAEASDPCERAELPDSGSRVVAALQEGPDGLEVPVLSALFVLEDGVAVGSELTLPEGELIDRIRGATGQYAFPAGDEDEGASISWVTIVSVGGAVLAIFAVGLVLMRIWHRIDPT